ncbi:MULTISPECIES: DUF2165 family protein [Alteromonadaceae]|uniref:DUF2165 family protein n=1 Tax=Alteromonadaceae TaxID=72275 RepID=UPI001C0955C4|nr:MULTISPECIES: DUF2165 family protein [Aliiglaciecola]MBU2877410.1 DUF2165 domain-containing protein [Aliiglaciecola lipolytica]MDO6712832.1 DUF2165 family protein [Aliiglaciecola sp. 2_MG-2023]MDO6753927.1 DUF2165 family protein [Aliiglaciecola sp. 1_MG-2023]
MLRRAKSIMILTVALWGFVGSFHNLIDWDGTLAAVGAATSMVTVTGGTESWQATSNTLVIWIGALLILGAKLTTGVMCTLGSIRMWRAHNANSTVFNAAKQIALTGCAVAIIMLFGGFIIIAESWFELWRSESMLVPVLGSAFRYAGMISLIAIFVALKD